MFDPIPDAAPPEDTAALEASAMSAALTVASPRLRPRHVSLASLSIYAAIVLLWAALFSFGFILNGPWAWSSGVIYVIYDTALLLVVAANTRWLSQAPLSNPPAAARPSLAVIVAAHNEAAGLPATIAALLAQHDAPEQILIADDGSSDSTPQALLQHFGLTAPASGMLSAASPQHPTLRWLRLPHGGKARALNAAILALETEIVLTVDADTLLEPNAIGAMRAAFASEPNLAAAAGVLSPVCAQTGQGRFFQLFQSYEYMRNFISRAAWMRLDSLLLVSGAFAGFRRDALRAVGGFDPECLVEDYELIHRLHRHASDHRLNWSVRVIGAARASTDAPSAIAPFLRQRRRWFAGFLQTQYWNRDMTGDSRYGRLGVIMLPIKAIDTMQPIFGLTAFFFLMLFLATGRLQIATVVLAIMLVKIAFDLAFHLWSIHLYQRWIGDGARVRFSRAALATFLEPFSFQLLRHAGAALGWAAFLRGRHAWGAKARLVDPVFETRQISAGEPTKPRF